MYCETYNVQLVMKDKPIKSGLLSICSVIYSTQEFSTFKNKNDYQCNNLYHGKKSCKDLFLRAMIICQLMNPSPTPKYCGTSQSKV